MPQQYEFLELVRRVRAGDQKAAEDLVRQYEPIIRVTIRTRLSDTSMRRVFDSLDICQSVLASFFTRMALGQYDLEEPGHLIGLLVRMATNKLAGHARKHTHRKQLLPQVADGQEMLLDLPDDEDPERVVDGRDLLQAVQARLSGEERDLAERRGRGQTWVEIAAELGGSPQARRKQLGRALGRVSAELNLDLAGDEEDRDALT